MDVTMYQSLVDQTDERQPTVEVRRDDDGDIVLDFEEIGWRTKIRVVMRQDQFDVFVALAARFCTSADVATSPDAVEG